MRGDCSLKENCGTISPMKSNAILLVLSLALGLLCSEIAVRFTGVAPTVYRLSPEGEGSAY
ncbi:hypothetical protein MRY87_08375, partial [bacterium]|nr:hypothetical protein [bacterium]